MGWKRQPESLFRRLRSALVTILALAAAVPATARAQLDIYPADARSDGMGAAFTAVAEGAAAAWWNPAALPFGPGISVLPVSSMDVTPQQRLGFGRSSREQSILYTSAAALRIGSVGVGAVYQEVDRSWTSWRGTVTGSEFRAARIGAGLDLSPRFFPDSQQFAWSLGGNLKWFGNESSVLGGVDDAVWDADFGTAFIYRPQPAAGSPREQLREEVAVRFGAVLVNAFDQEIQLATYDTRPLGRSLRLGLAGEIGGFDSPGRGPAVRFLVDVDWLQYLGKVSDRESGMNMGVELELLRLVALRSGMISSYASGPSHGVGLDSHDLLGRLRLQVDVARVGHPGLYHFDAAVHWRL
jgi:hypothetical protein